MTQENKNLLIKDLCSRLPYEVKVQYEDGIFTIDHISAMYEEVKLNTHNNYTIDVLEVKPYLFPLSSMTEDQLYELREIFGFEIEFSNGFIELSTFHHNKLGYLEMDAMFEWFNKNHFDYRGLIPAGAAIDATGLNIY
jgi:hypothetical protein